MRNTPMLCTPQEITNMTEKGLLPPRTIPEHPMATWLYKHFREGSNGMTKGRAYDIGNELDRLQAEVERYKAAGASLVRQVLEVADQHGKRS